MPDLIRGCHREPNLREAIPMKQRFGQKRLNKPRRARRNVQKNRELGIGTVPIKAVFFTTESTESTEKTLSQGETVSLLRRSLEDEDRSFRAEPNNKSRSLLFPSLEGRGRGEGEIKAMTRNPSILVIARL